MIFYPCKLNTSVPPVVNNCITTESGYALDARQANPNITGSILYQVYRDIGTKINVTNGVIKTNDDWNTYTTSGAYKIQGPDSKILSGYNGPTGLYGYGVLIVFRVESVGEMRTVQIYFPHHDTCFAFRCVHLNGTKDADWTVIAGTTISDI